jgi:hypothetical protein
MPSERVQRQIDRLLDEAEQAITQSDWALVTARCPQMLALDRETGDAHAYLAAAARAMGDGGRKRVYLATGRQRSRREAPEYRLETARTLAIGIAVSRALAFAHEQGIIHRDLKPGTVWPSEPPITPSPLPCERVGAKRGPGYGAQWLSASSRWAASRS